MTAMKCFMVRRQLGSVNGNSLVCGSRKKVLMSSDLTKGAAKSLHMMQSKNCKKKFVKQISY